MMPTTTMPASTPIRSANGAASYQPGATPQGCVRSFHQGPTARPIGGETDSTFVVAARGWDGLSALGFVWASFPGALPQAGMAAHLWCLGKARDLEPTIARPLLSRWERTEVRVRPLPIVAEILEA